MPGSHLPASVAAGIDLDQLTLVPGSFVSQHLNQSHSDPELVHWSLPGPEERFLKLQAEYNRRFKLL